MLSQEEKASQHVYEKPATHPPNALFGIVPNFRRLLANLELVLLVHLIYGPMRTKIQHAKDDKSEDRCCISAYAGNFGNTANTVFDACLELGSAEPYQSVANMEMGSCDTDGYRSRLALKGDEGCKRAIPQPDSVKRTTIQ